MEAAEQSTMAATSAPHTHDLPPPPPAAPPAPAQPPLRSEQQRLDAADRVRVQSTYRLPSLDCASCLAVLPDGNLVVADTGAHRCLILSPDTGTIVGALGGRSATRPTAPLRGPRGLAVGGGALFVADCYNCMIRKLALADGAELASVGRYGDSDGELRYPHGLALSADGATLFVADSGNGRIAVFAAADLAYRHHFELEQQRPVALSKAAAQAQAMATRGFPTPRSSSCRPTGLAVVDDELFVVDSFNKRLQVFSTSGAFRRFLVPLHLDGAARGQLLLTLPEGLAADGGRLFVSDRRGDAIHVLAPEDGQSLQALPFLMHRPHGLAGVCHDGQRAYVVDELRNEVQVITSLSADAARKAAAEKRAQGTPRSTPRSSSPRSSTPRSTALPLPRASSTPRATPHTTGTTPRAVAATASVAGPPAERAAPSSSTPRGAARQPPSARRHSDSCGARVEGGGGAPTCARAAASGAASTAPRPTGGATGEGAASGSSHGNNNENHCQQQTVVPAVPVVPTLVQPVQLRRSEDVAPPPLFPPRPSERRRMKKLEVVV